MIAKSLLWEDGFHSEIAQWIQSSYNVAVILVVENFDELLYHASIAS